MLLKYDIVDILKSKVPETGLDKIYCIQNATQARHIHVWSLSQDDSQWPLKDILRFYSRNNMF